MMLIILITGSWKFYDQITNSLEQRCYKELRNENFQSVKIVMCIYRKLLVSCKEQMWVFVLKSLWVCISLFLIMWRLLHHEIFFFLVFSFPFLVILVTIFFSTTIKRKTRKLYSRNSYLINIFYTAVLRWESKSNSTGKTLLIK